MRLPTVRLRPLLALLAAALPAVAGHPYLPGVEGARLGYVSQLGGQDAVRMYWRTVCQRITPLPDEAERLTFQVQEGRGDDGGGWQRTERFVLEPRGVFAVKVGDDVNDFGPFAVLPPAERLEQREAFWHYRGVRQLPMPFRLLGLMRTGDRVVETMAHYRVLGVEEVRVPAGRFERAVRLGGLVSYKLDLPGGLDWLITRTRQWHVPGVGLVRETLEFVDVPRLGTVVTELSTYAGVQPTERPQLARLAEEIADDAA